MGSLLRLFNGLVYFCAALSFAFFFRAKSPRSAQLTWLKLAAQGLAPFMAAAGAAGSLLGALRRKPLAILAGLFSAIASITYIRAVTSKAHAVERVFGEGWKRKLSKEQSEKILELPWRPGPAFSAGMDEVRFDQDVVFWTIPETGRQLLCDVWHPAEAATSGIGVIYLHGSAWHYLGKDFGTRPMFTHFASQGHVVMDVAYRMCPETDLFGMAGDVQRAIAWMKQNALRLGIDSDRIVLCGGSAGGHLALLIGYANERPEFRPADIAGTDTSVAAVINYYGPTDLGVYHDHVTKLWSDIDSAPSDEGVFGWAMKRVRETFLPGVEPVSHHQLMRNLVGGLPDEAPKNVELGSPVRHVSSKSPPTLQISGEHDAITSAAGVRELHDKLIEAGVPSILVMLPWTDHAFDVALGPLSQNSVACGIAIHEVDRFLYAATSEGARAARSVAGLPEARQTA